MENPCSFRVFIHMFFSAKRHDLSSLSVHYGENMFCAIFNEKSTVVAIHSLFFGTKKSLKAASLFSMEENMFLYMFAMQGSIIGAKIGFENRIWLYYFLCGLQNQPPTRGEFQTGSKFLAESNVSFEQKKFDM